VEYDALLDRFGRINESGKYESEIQSKGKRFGAMVAPLIGGRVTVGKAACDGAEIGLRVAITYAHQRTQFPSGRDKDKTEMPIISYITHKYRLYTRLSTTYAYHIVMSFSKMLCATSKDTKWIHVVASGVKAMATWNRADTLRQCRECCGGMGYSELNQISTILTHYEVDLTYEGDNTVLLQQVSRHLLTAYSKGALHPPALMPAATAESVKSLDYLLSLFAWREWVLVQQLHESISHDVANGKHLGEAWNDQLVISSQLAKSWVERLALEQMMKCWEKADEDLKPIVLLIGQMFAVWRVEQDLLTFTLNELMTKEVAKRVQTRVLELCEEIHPHAMSLVRAFGIPDYMITAPIAGDYIRFFRFDNKEIRV